MTSFNEGFWMIFNSGFLGWVLGYTIAMTIICGVIAIIVGLFTITIAKFKTLRKRIR